MIDKIAKNVIIYNRYFCAKNDIRRVYEMSDPKNLKNDPNSYDCLITLGDAQNGDAHEGETPHCEPDTEEAVPVVSTSETDWTAKPPQEKSYQALIMDEFYDRNRTIMPNKKVRMRRSDGSEVEITIYVQN